MTVENFILFCSVRVNPKNVRHPLADKAVPLPTSLLVAAQPGLGEDACWSLTCKNAAFSDTPLVQDFSRSQHSAKPPALYADELLQEERVDP